ncbi:MAG: hypothetical protein Kow0092_03840 [Deferrisomatales bacterium]
MLREADEQGEGDPARATLRRAWTRYNLLYQGTQETFEECLTFMGGLAFRDQGLDQSICEIADELIRCCADDSTGDPWRSLTVPAPRETVTKTLAKIIRLRFQEWTLWTLPFTAHEFGHVVVEEKADDEDLRGFLEEQVGLLEALESGDAGSEGERRERAEAHVKEFLADAFATYTMGPAYPCAGILLRFDPSAPEGRDPRQPHSGKRARVALEMLRAMDAQAGTSPYAAVIGILEKRWEDALGRMGSAAALPSAYLQWLEGFVARISDVFYLVIRPSARYPYTGDRGWLVADQWHRTWRRQLEDGEELYVDATAQDKLCDVLNAAWLCRLFKPPGARDREIERAAYDLCKRIIDRRRRPARTRRGRGRSVQQKGAGKGAR